jgi:hypothetical protein
LIGVAALHIAIGAGLGFAVPPGMFASMARFRVPVLTHAHAAALCVGDACAAEADGADESESDEKFVSQNRGLPQELKLVERFSSTPSPPTSQ